MQYFAQWGFAVVPCTMMGKLKDICFQIGVAVHHPLPSLLLHIRPQKYSTSSVVNPQCNRTVIGITCS